MSVKITGEQMLQIMATAKERVKTSFERYSNSP